MPGYGHYRPFQEGLTRHLSSQGFLISYLSVGCRKGALHQENGWALNAISSFMYLTMTLSLRYFYRNFFRLWQLATIVEVLR